MTTVVVQLYPTPVEVCSQFHTAATLHLAEGAAVPTT
jgi:hypothetical protein